MQQVRRLQIRTRRQVSDVLAGAYLSVFKGSGVEFDEVRPYVPGDDVRSIDWNVTARTGVPHIKRFVEERELSMMLLVDVSASMDVGSLKSKRSSAAEFGALVGFSAMANQDKVGVMLFSNREHLFIPPRKGQQHGLRIIRELLSPSFDQKILQQDKAWWLKWARWWKQKGQTHNRQTDIKAGLEFCQQILKRRSIVFVISDCRDDGYWKQLQALNQRHDVVLVQVVDPIDARLPEFGLMRVQDAESGECIWVDAGDRRLQSHQQSTHDQFVQTVEQRARRAGIDHIVLSTDQAAIDPLLAFMRRRERRR
jgi:uncharacterized protein (DUF58 family)